MKSEIKAQPIIMAQGNAYDETAPIKDGGPESQDATLQDLRNATVGLSREDRDHSFAEALDLDLTTREKAFLRIALGLLRENVDMDTPVEKFLASLIWQHGQHALSNETIQQELQEFEENWQDCLETARKFYRENRCLLT